ncbi:MAG: M56 family metallopeptidase [Bacteroidota bacterium]
MLLQIIQLTLVWLAGYLFTFLWLGNDKLPVHKRVLILGTLTVGLLLPLLPLGSFFPVDLLAKSGPLGLDFPPEAIMLPEIEFQAGQSYFRPWSMPLWLFIWALGALLMASRLFYGWLQIIRCLKQTSSIKLMGRCVRSLPLGQTMPFSYGTLLFWPGGANPESEEWLPIWKHECAHIDQGHTYDLLFIDLIGIVLWWHPLLWVFRSHLRFQHELLADRAALSDSGTDKNAYGRMLLLSRPEKLYPIKVHAFHQKFIKKRINMLTQSNGSPNKCWLLAVLFPVLVFACGQLQEEEAETTPEESIESESTSYASRTEVDTIITFDPETFEESMALVESVVYTEAEHFPIYGDCDHVSDDPEAAHNCSFTNLMQAIVSNMQYPRSAKDLGIEGVSFLKLLIPAQGDQIYASPHKSSIDGVEDVAALSEEEVQAYEAIDAAAMAAWQSIPKADWQPARIGDEPVTMELILPIRFSLQ